MSVGELTRQLEDLSARYDNLHASLRTSEYAKNNLESQLRAIRAKTSAMTGQLHFETELSVLEKVYWSEIA